MSIYRRISPAWFLVLWPVHLLALVLKVALLPFILLGRLLRPRRTHRGGW